jgi:hypothetical protein
LQFFESVRKLDPEPCPRPAMTCFLAGYPSDFVNQW